MNIKKKFDKLFWKNKIEPNDHFYTWDGKGNWVAAYQLIWSFIEKALSSQRKELIEEIVEAYDNKAQEYNQDGLRTIGKLMIDVRDIALELLDKMNMKKEGD